MKGIAPGVTTGFAQGATPTPGSCICANFNAKPAVPVTVQVPFSEITAYQGTYQETAGQFLMTLLPSIFNYDGHLDTESSPVIGANTCWWTGPAQYPTVQGSTWTVGQGNAGHDQYGLDTVGFGKATVNAIQAQGAAHGIQFPCTVTIYQEMNYDGIDVYTDNLLTQTIGSKTVQVCRAGVCSGTIPF